jgi:hypothetical protein
MMLLLELRDNRLLYGLVGGTVSDGLKITLIGTVDVGQSS